MRFWSFLLAIFWVMTVPLTAEAQDKPRNAQEKLSRKPNGTKWTSGRFRPMDWKGTTGKPWRPALKGLNIDLGQNAAICFDTERLA